MSDFANALTAYQSPMSVEDAAKIGGVSTEKFRLYLKQNGLMRAMGETRRLLESKAASRENIDELVISMYLGSYSEKAIAKHFNTSRSVITLILKKAGIERRSQADANRLMMSQRTPEENRINASAAHEASRGSVTPDEVKIKRAQTIEQIGKMNASEQLMKIWLENEGVKVIPQKAEGIYNVDLALPELSVAVEIFGGGFHASGRHLSRAPERMRYLFDQGWGQIIIWVDNRKHPLTVCACGEVIRIANILSSQPTSSREYWMIRGDGELIGAFSFDSDDLSRVFTTRSGIKSTSSDNLTRN